MWKSDLYDQCDDFFQVPDYKSCKLAHAEEKCRKKKHTVAKIITWHNITVINKLYEENVKVVHLVRDPRSRYLSAKELSLLTKKTDAQYEYQQAVRRRQSRETISFKKKELRELQKMNVGDFLKKKYNSSFDETVKAECKKDTNEFLQNLPKVCSIIFQVVLKKSTILSSSGISFPGDPRLAPGTQLHVHVHHSIILPASAQISSTT